MSDGDEQQQRELEEERMMHALAVLQRVKRNQATGADVSFLACELGLTTLIQRREAA